MTLNQCREDAKSSGTFNTGRFLIFQDGMAVEARWLDAWFGLFQIDGESGHRHVDDYQDQDVTCEPL